MAQNNDFGLRAYEARMNITWQGQNGDLVDAVPFDATDTDLKTMAVEALRGGSVPGVAISGRVDLEGFVVDRFPASESTPYNRVFVRPKTPFGR